MPSIPGGTETPRFGYLNAKHTYEAATLRIVGIKDLSASDQICKDGLLKAGQDPDAYRGRYDLADAFKACADRVKWVPR